MSFHTEEYHQLLEAQRAIGVALRPKTAGDGKSLVYADAREVAALAVALTRVVDQKRVMRGQPAPRPAEMTPKGQRKPRTQVQVSGPTDAGGQPLGPA